MTGHNMRQLIKETREMERADKYAQFAEPWIGRKMREKVDEHKRRYPGFAYAEQYIDWALSLEPKTQRYEAYQPISKWSASRRKWASLKSLAQNEHL